VAFFRIKGPLAILDFADHFEWFMMMTNFYATNWSSVHQCGGGDTSSTTMEATTYPSHHGTPHISSVDNISKPKDFRKTSRLFATSPPLPPPSLSDIAHANPPLPTLNNKLSGVTGLSKIRYFKYYSTSSHPSLTPHPSPPPSPHRKHSSHATLHTTGKHATIDTETRGL